MAVISGLDILIPWDYLIRAVVFITAGVVLANIIVETGLLNRLRTLTRPLCRICGLSEPCALSLLTMVASSTAGKSMLAEYYRKGDLEKKEIIPTLLLGTFPSVLGESLFRVQLPTAIVLLGPVVGMAHTLLNLFSTFLQALFALCYSHLFLRHAKRACEPDIMPPVPGVHLDRATVVTGWKKALPTLKRVIPAALIATLAVSILQSAGLMDVIADVFNPLLNVLGLPGESSTALVAQFIHFSAGYAVVANLMMEGVLVVKTALITLVIGTMVIITMVYIKYTGPLYLSLFGTYGVKVTVVAYCSSMAAKMVTILMIMVFL
jgi:hypothetical protein